MELQFSLMRKQALRISRVPQPRKHIFVSHAVVVSFDSYAACSLFENRRRFRFAWSCQCISHRIFTNCRIALEIESICIAGNSNSLDFDPVLRFSV